MANKYEKIATVTVGAGGAANITFSSIPQTYTDLCLFISARSEVAGNFSDEVIKLNNTTSSYTNRYIYGNGSSAFGGSNAYSSLGGFSGGMPGDTATASTFGNKMIYIPNYAGSNNKAYFVDGVAETNATTAYIHLLAGLRSNTDAVTSIVLVTDAGADYAQHTTATLYGIKNS
jgi:hypothetical protein